MLTLILLIAFFATVIEFALQWWFKPLRRFLDRQTWARIPFSLLISFILGAGGGQIVMIGAMVVSTGFSIFFYGIHLLEIAEAVFDVTHRLKKSIVDFWITVGKAWNRIRHPIKSRP